MNKKKAFTLVELLVVIAIIGLLATLSVLSLNNARAKARDAKRVADVKQMMTALELYFNDNQQYTSSLVPGGQIASGTTVYMNVVPTPPTPPIAVTQYTYTPINDNASYTLEYFLEGNVGSIPAGSHIATFFRPSAAVPSVPGNRSCRCPAWESYPPCG